MPLSNAPTDLKERAKQGDEKAIAAVLNHFFQPQGITAKATLKGENLLLLIESEMVPDRDTLVPFIHQGLANLGIANIKPNVKIAGREKGTKKGTAWKQEIDLEDPPEPIMPDGDNDSSLSDDDDMPIEEDDFLDEPLTEEENDDYYLEEDSSLEEAKPQEKSSKNKLLILSGVVLLLLLAAGAAAYFFLPGLLGGNETTSSQPMSTPEKESSTEKPEVPKASEANATGQPEAANATGQPEAENATGQPEAENSTQETPESSETPEDAATNEADPTSGSIGSSVPFYDAVKNANKAWEMTQVASSSQEWTEIAILWNDALVLMKQVPESHSDYDLAQDRIPKYRKYREFAKEMAELSSQWSRF